MIVFVFVMVFVFVVVFVIVFVVVFVIDNLRLFEVVKVQPGLPPLLWPISGG